ncbi:MAG: hypothetical protein ACYCZN_15030 [Candidatus Dormibacteria bacterium]
MPLETWIVGVEVAAPDVSDDAARLVDLRLAGHHAWLPPEIG